MQLSALRTEVIQLTKDMTMLTGENRSLRTQNKELTEALAESAAYAKELERNAANAGLSSIGTGTISNRLFTPEMEKALAEQDNNKTWIKPSNASLIFPVRPTRVLFTSLPLHFTTTHGACADHCLRPSQPSFGRLDSDISSIIRSVPPSAWHQ
jgi:regulator of replication initiation timing